jgi:lipoprotein-anchoring transpeptidase ErfK/SrfK
MKGMRNEFAVGMQGKLRFFAVALAALSGVEPAVGQNYPRPPDNYGYDGGLPDGEADPYGDFDRPTRARPHRGLLPEERDYGGYPPDRPPPGVAAPGSRRPTRLAALPPDADPAYSTALDFDDQVDPDVATRELVDDPTGRPAGTITIDTKARKLYLSAGNGQAYEYGVGVGREGFAWKGEAQVGRKAFWPGWTPPRDMLLRRPDLPDHMDGGLDNPLGARALYLFKGKKDTMFRIHGTNEPDTIGQAVSSGCIRMLNADVIDLYRRVSKGARVVVL